MTRKDSIPSPFGQYPRSPDMSEVHYLDAATFVETDVQFTINGIADEVLDVVILEGGTKRRKIIDFNVAPVAETYHLGLPLLVGAVVDINDSPAMAYTVPLGVKPYARLTESDAIVGYAEQLQITMQRLLRNVPVALHKTVTSRTLVDLETGNFMVIPPHVETEPENRP